MNYSYFSTSAFLAFKKTLGYQAVAPFIYLGAYKQKRLLNWPLAVKIIRKFLPQIDIDLDMAAVDERVLAELINRHRPYRIGGASFSKLNLDGFDVKSGGTFILDLNHSRSELWRKMDYSLRKQIKKAERFGFTIRRIDNVNHFRKYYQLLCDSRSRMGFATDKYGVMKGLWDFLHKDVCSCYEVFLCFNENGDLLAGLGLIINPDTDQCIEVAAARSEKAKNLPAGDYLKWEMIKWAKGRGLKYFDLAGVEIASSASWRTRNDSKKANIYRYKKKWGGGFYPVYYYEKYR